MADPKKALEELKRKYTPSLTKNETNSTQGNKGTQTSQSAALPSGRRDPKAALEALKKKKENGGFRKSDSTQSNSPATNNATGKRSYYSAAEMQKNRDYLYSDITDMESSFLTKQKQVENAISELERLAGQVRVNPGNEQIYNNYMAAYNNYTKLWSEYEPMQTNYSNAVNAYNDEYTNWRGTIRDASEIDKALADLDAQAKAINRDLHVYKAGAGAGHEMIDDIPVANKIAELTAQLDEIEKQRALLVEEKNWAEHFSYADLMGGTDFEEYSAKGAAIENPEVLDGTKPIGNIVTYNRNNENSTVQKFDHMTDDEVAIYNYLLAKEGQESAAEYLRHLDEYLNARMGQETGENIRNIDNWLGRVAATGAYGFVSGVDQFASGMAQFFTKEDLPTSAMQYASQYIQKDLEDNRLGGYLYNATTTIGNMAPSILVSSVTGGLAGAAGAAANVAGTVGKIAGAATMGTSAAGNAYGQALAEGYSQGQARTYSSLVGASEAVLQYAIGGIGKLGGVADDVLLTKIAAFDSGLKRAALTAGVKLGSEVLEEELQNFIEPLIASVVFRENYDAPTIEELVETAVVTFLTTGALEGGNIVSAGSNKLRMDTEIAQAIIDEGLAADVNSQGHKLAQALQSQMDRGKTVNDFQINTLYGQNVETVDATTDPDAALAEAAREVVAREMGVEATEMAQERTLVEGEETPAQTANEAPAPTRGANERTSEVNGHRNVLNKEKSEYGEYGKRVYEEIFDGEVQNADRAKTQFEAAYNAGRYNLPRNMATLNGEVQEKAYDAGRRDFILDMNKDPLAEQNAAAYNGINNNGTEGLSYGTAEEVYLRNSGQRNGSAYPGGQVSAVEAGPGRNQIRQAQAQPADRGTASLTYGKRVSTASLGIAGGSKSKSIYIVTGGDTVSTSAAKKLAKERGLRLVLYAGDNLQITQADGSVASVRAFISGDRVFVRVDHPRYTSDQLMRHEAGHDMIAKGEINPDTVRKRIDQEFGKEKARQLAENYVSAYEGTGLTPEEIWEEVICDSLGDMNIFSGTTVEAQTGELLAETKKASAETKTESTRGPPKTESKTSRDLDERRRALRKGEMVNKFRNKVNWPAYYEKLKSGQYNSDNYDDGDIAYMYLDGYTLKLEMQKNGEFSVIGRKKGVYRGQSAENRGSSVGYDGRSKLPGERDGDRGGRDRLGERSRKDGSEDRTDNRSGKDAKGSGEGGTAVRGVNGKASREVGYAPTFYSHMERVVEGVKQEKLGASSVVSMLRGKGVKAEEIKWSGIETFLEGKKSVTKQELLEFMHANRLEIEEVELSDYGPTRMNAETGEAVETWEDFANQAFEIAEANGFDPDDVQFDDWDENWTAYIYDRETGETIDIASANVVEEAGSDTRWGEYKLKGGKNYREYLFKMPGSDYSNAAMNVHWNEGGIIAHARVQDFNTPNGKVLFIEEIQSDWHNEGQKKGYASEVGEAKERIRKLEAQKEKLNADRDPVEDRFEAFAKRNRARETTPEEVELERRIYGEWMQDFFAKEKDINEKIARLERTIRNAIPDAPYAKTYHEFVLKNLLRMAAEGGYNSIGWTTADMQSERWSEDYAEGYRIEYDQDIPKFLNKYGKQWGAKVGKVNLDQGGKLGSFDTERIQELEADKAEWVAELEESIDGDQDGFIQRQIDYIDNMIAKIKRSALGEEVWVFPITKAMKQSVLYEGQPKFSRELDSAGKELTKEQAEFFKDSQVRDKDGNLQVVYHGTEKGGFTVFSVTDDIGYFFTSREEVARTYSGSYKPVYVSGSIKTWDDAIAAMKEFGYDVSLKRRSDGNYVLHDGTFGDEVFAPDELDNFVEMYEQDYLSGEEAGNYEVYLNIKNPLVINGNGSNWNSVYDWYDGMVAWADLTEEQQEAFIDEYGDDVGDWGIDPDSLDSLPIYHPGDLHVATPMRTRDWVREAAESGVYDGVIFRNISDDGKFGQGYSNESDVYVVFNSNQIKSVHNKKPTEHDDIRFSMETPVEETKTLIALHNLTADKLQKALKLGGFPMPSIAVTKADIPHTNFGDITLVMDKSTVDPKASKKNTVYSADAWTPTFPRVEYDVNRDAEAALYDKVHKAGGKLPEQYANRVSAMASSIEDYLNNDGTEEGVIDRFKGEYAIKALYLADKGETVETKTQEIRHEKQTSEVMDAVLELFDEDIETLNKVPLNELHSKYAEDIKRVMMSHGKTEEQADMAVAKKSGLFGGFANFISRVVRYAQKPAYTTETVTDTKAMEKDIDSKLDMAEYEKWLRNLFRDLIKDTGVYNNKGLFTPSGNRRSFKQTHYPVTLENIAKAMAEQNGGNSKHVTGFNGIKSLRAGTAVRFKSIAHMHELEGRLKHLTQDEADAINDALSTRMYNIIERIYNKKQHSKSSNSFIEYDTIGNILMEVTELDKYTVDSIQKCFSKYQYNLGNQLAMDIRDLLFDVTQMPVNIFEAKPERAVRFDEVLAAVLPDNAPANLREQLEQEGVNVLTYKYGDNDARLKAVNSVEGSKFSQELESVKELRKNNARLKEVNAALKEQFKTTKFAKVDPKALRAAARKILKGYDSNADLDETLSSLDELYTYLANGEDGNTPVWNTAYRMAYETATRVLEDASVLNDDLYQEYAGLRNYLRTTGISLDKEYEEDLQGYENLSDFRKRNFGRIKIVNKGLDVNTAYSELASMYPGLLSDEAISHPADQLVHLADVLDSLRPYEENPYSYNMREAATWLANDIMERFFELPQAKPTFADKAERKLTEQVIKDSKKLEAMRERSKEKIDKILAEYREKVKETRKKEKAAKWEAVEKTKEHYKAKEAKMSESRRARALRERITRHASELKQKLLRPTDKKHIPQELQGAVAKLLECINQESRYEYVVDEDGRTHRVDRGTVAGAEPAKRTQAFAELQAVYAQLANELTIDPDLLGDDGLLNDVIKLADKPLATMTSEELQIVWTTLRAVEASVRTANKIHNATRWLTVAEAAEALYEDNGEKKDKVELRGILGKGQKLTGLDMETPETYFHLLGKAGEGLFRAMRNSQDQHIRLMKEVADFTHETLDKVNVRKLENQMHDVTLGGEKVKLSTAQIMELYVLMKREQALDHIFVGGILPDVVSAKGLKKITKASPARGITLDEVSEAVNKLTKEQQEIADKLQQYASTTLGKWGNQAAMKVYGYEKFGDKNYWPIRVNRQEVKSDIQKDTAVTSLANRSFTKGTKPHANNSLRLGSIFDTFSTHASEMATYSAWLGTLEDINRIRNYTFRDEDGHATDTVKAIIDTVHGTSGNAYLDKLLADVTNGVKGTHGETAYMSGLVGNFKAAAVGANLRVIIQQPTAMLRAADVIGAQYMAAPGNPLKGWEKAKKYAPIAQWKDWGYFDINTGRQMKDVLFDSDTVVDKAKSISMWGAGAMDSLAWGHLWNAVEAETKAKREELKPGTEAFYEVVAARFTEVVDHTQVVDGILQRSQIMRSADGVTKMATSFMGEPTKQYNMMMQAAYDAKVTKGKDRKAAVKKLARTATVLAISGVANAMAQSIIDAVRDDDKEEEYWEKLLAAFKENLGSTFNPVSYVPFAKDILSILQGYDVSRMDMESIEKLVSAGQNMIKALKGEGKYTVGGAAINLVAEIARLVGIPVSNLKREITSFAMLAAVETDNYIMQYRMEKWMLSMNGNSSKFVSILYNAYMNDKDAFDIIYADMVANDYFKTEERTTAEVIADRIKPKLMDTLFNLYDNDQAAYKAMYADLIKRDFLKTGVKTNDPKTDTFVSTADAIATAMESRMKKDQGVKNVGDLDQRYYSPEDQIKYDEIMSSVEKSGMWGEATEVQKDNLRSDLYTYLAGDSKTAQDFVDKIDAAKAYGIDETEFLLYKLALEMYDTPNKNGELGGTPTNEEKATAIFAMGNLSDSEIAALWDTEKGYEAYAAGVDMGAYVEYLGAGGSVSLDKMIDAQDYGISTTKYLDFLDMLDKYDQPTESGKYGSFTQDEATAAIAAMPGLTNSQRAYLWQSVNKGWKSTNNSWR